MLAATITGPVLKSAVPSQTTATGWSTAPVRTRPAMPWNAGRPSVGGSTSVGSGVTVTPAP